MSTTAAKHCTPRGALIVLEGGDRCGKTTQVQLLAKSIANSIVLKFPDRSSPCGQIIHKYLTNSTQVDDETIHHLFAANRREHEARMRQMLINGIHVIVDRYAYSGVAFSAAKGLNLDWCMRSDVGLPQPDLVIYLDLSPDAIATRGGYGNERYETHTMQSKVRDIFLNRLLDTTYWRVVNADQTIECLQHELVQLVTELAIKPTAAGAPLKDLWTDRLERFNGPNIDTLLQQATQVNVNMSASSSSSSSSS